MFAPLCTFLRIVMAWVINKFEMTEAKVDPLEFFTCTTVLIAHQMSVFTCHDSTFNCIVSFPA
jgi:hypothetical protein